MGRRVGVWGIFAGRAALRRAAFLGKPKTCRVHFFQIRVVRRFCDEAPTVGPAVKRRHQRAAAGGGGVPVESDPRSRLDQSVTRPPSPGRQDHSHAVTDPPASRPQRTRWRHAHIPGVPRSWRGTCWLQSGRGLIGT